MLVYTGMSMSTGERMLLYATSLDHLMLAVDGHWSDQGLQVQQVLVDYLLEEFLEANHAALYTELPFNRCDEQDISVESRP